MNGTRIRDFTMGRIYLSSAERLKKRERFALAVIVEAKGSAPQAAGAAALISASGRIIEGTVGGGILEAEVRRKASAALKRGTSLLVPYSLKEDGFSEDGAVCGGAVKVLIDPRPARHRAAFERMSRSLSARRPGVLVTRIGGMDGAKVTLKREWAAAGSPSPYRRAILKALAVAEPRLVAIKRKNGLDRRGDHFVFLEPVLPLPRLIIAGAGHIGRAVARLGRLLDFEVSVIDDRPEFANRANLPDADRIDCGDIGETLGTMSFSRDSFVVIVTRGHRHDAEALRACIHSRAGYIGMIGSRRKIALTRKEFLARRWAGRCELGRVHAPIGLPIGSRSVEEIAVSIAAELVRERSRLRGNKDVPE
jgi:xanthine dehydrogenase accessory factor